MPKQTRIPAPAATRGRLPRVAQLGANANTPSRIPTTRRASATAKGDTPTPTRRVSGAPASGTPRRKSQTGANGNAVSAPRRSSAAKITTPKPFRFATSSTATPPGISTATKRRLSEKNLTKNAPPQKTADRRNSTKAGSQVVRPVTRHAVDRDPRLRAKKVRNGPSLRTAKAPSAVTSPRTSLSGAPSALESFRAARRASLAKAGAKEIRPDTDNATPAEVTSPALESFRDRRASQGAVESDERKVKRTSNRFVASVRTANIDKLRNSLGTRRTSNAGGELPAPPELRRASLNKVIQIAADGDIPGCDDEDLLMDDI